MEGEQQEGVTLEEGEQQEGVVQLDLVFCLDCTGSMGSYIEAAQSNIIQIVESISQSKNASVRFGLVAYRDHPPQDLTYITKVHEFTSDLGQMKVSLSKLSASGGGDGPEAVTAALEACCNLPYRDAATKIVVTIADAPPHGLPGNYDGFPDGDPNGLDPIIVVRNMLQKGIVIYAVGCEPALGHFQFARDFFSAIAKMTGGQFLPLTSANLLADVIIGGAKEEMSLNQLKDEVKAQVADLENSHLSKEEMVALVAESLQKRGVKTHKIRVDYPYEFDQTYVELFCDASSFSEATKKLPAKKIATSCGVYTGYSTTSTSTVTEAPISRSYGGSERFQKAILAENEGKYDEMCEIVDSLIREDPHIGFDERTIFSAAFKGAIGERRFALSSLEKDMEGKPEDTSEKRKTQISSETTKLCKQVLDLITEHLLPTQEGASDETEVFYLKMAADHCRYLAELSPADETYVRRGSKFYSDAFEMAKGVLNATHPTRLGLMLNYSIFCHEIEKDPAKAKQMAKEAFDDSISKLDTLDDASYKDSTLVMQLLRDNLTLWVESDDVDDESEEKESAKEKPKLSEEEPKLSEAEPKLSEEEPKISEKKVKLSEEKVDHVEEKPRLSEAKGRKPKKILASGHSGRQKAHQETSVISLDQVERLLERELLASK